MLFLKIINEIDVIFNPYLPFLSELSQSDRIHCSVKKISSMMFALLNKKQYDLY